MYLVAIIHYLAVGGVSSAGTGLGADEEEEEEEDESTPPATSSISGVVKVDNVLSVTLDKVVVCLFAFEDVVVACAVVAVVVGIVVVVGVVVLDVDVDVSSAMSSLEGEK